MYGFVAGLAATLPLLFLCRSGMPLVPLLSLKTSRFMTSLVTVGSYRVIYRVSAASKSSALAKGSLSQK
jgi:hypothetical protein